jgi:hypothetical protein
MSHSVVDTIMMSDRSHSLHCPPADILIYADEHRRSCTPLWCKQIYDSFHFPDIIKTWEQQLVLKTVISEAQVQHMSQASRHFLGITGRQERPHYGLLYIPMQVRLV